MFFFYLLVTSIKKQLQHNHKENHKCTPTQYMQKTDKACEYIEIIKHVELEHIQSACSVYPILNAILQCLGQ